MPSILLLSLSITVNSQKMTGVNSADGSQSMDAPDTPACAYNDISRLLTLTHSWSLSGYLAAGFSLHRSHRMRPNLKKQQTVAFHSFSFPSARNVPHHRTNSEKINRNKWRWNGAEKLLTAKVFCRQNTSLDGPSMKRPPL